MGLNAAAVYGRVERMTVICTSCKRERPAGEEACPHCGAAAYPHRRTAEEHADYLRAVAEHDRGLVDGQRGRRSRLMHTLELRWEQGTWVYDDPEVGVYAEPFVLGADTMLSLLREAQVGPGRDPFRITFAASPFPGAVEARRLAEEDGGVWYEAELQGHVLSGWLCGHFFDYFESAPPAVYVRGDPVG
jgi:hypothetical protein